MTQTREDEATARAGATESAAPFSTTPVAQAPLYVSRFLRFTRVSWDVGALVLALAVASFVRFDLQWFEITETRTPRVSSYVAVSILWVAAVLVSSWINRLYEEDTLTREGGEHARVLRSVVEAVAAVSVLVFMTQTFDISRSWFGLVVVVTTVLIGGGRAMLRRQLDKARDRGLFRRPALLVSKTGEGTWPELSVDGVNEFDFVAHVTKEALLNYLHAVQSDRAASSRRGAKTSWRDAAVIVRSGDFDEDELWTIVLAAGQTGASAYLHSSVRSVGRDRLAVRELGGQTIMRIAPPRFAGFQAFQKRTMDVVASGLGLLVLSPFFVLVSLAVVVTSGRPIFYGQERVGRDGRIFKMWKFRTMKPDAEAETGPVWAAAEDPRRTPLGSILRRTSLDELPQLWNVLIGDMSLVGPRPERPLFVDKFSDELAWYQYRHRIRPGITGWAQAHGLRGNTSLDSRVEFDNWYIEHWSLLLDLKTLLRTVAEIFRGENAY